MFYNRAGLPKTSRHTCPVMKFKDIIMTFNARSTALLWQQHNDHLCLEAWGDGVRVRAGLYGIHEGLPGALLTPPPAAPPPDITLSADQATLVHADLRVELSAEGRVQFYQAQTGQLLLSEEAAHFTRPPSRWFRPHPGQPTGYLEARFEAHPDERFYGLGQHQHGRLDQKGCVIDQMQRNTEVCIPFMLSSRGYGFLWNNPALGRVELAHTGTRWVAHTTRQLDYWVCAGDTPASILQRYSAVVGRAPELPAWAAGFWQSRLRYASQSEVLRVAHEHKRRGLPLDILVIDAGYWPEMGNFQFTPQDWPDPAGMVAELAALGIRTMISVWPAVNRASPVYAAMQAAGHLARSDRGHPIHIAHLQDVRPADAPPQFTLYDATNLSARADYWARIQTGLYAHGIKLFWLDANEPELIPMDHDMVRYHLGSASEVGMLYPLLHQQGLYDGLRAAGETEVITLGRSAWAGSQRLGAAVWSGDTASTFDSLRRQVAAGLNIGLSGIVWWTTDIGGFYGGDPRDPAFRELIVRWFQYGVFCPLFRLHGFREPAHTHWMYGGADNEIWSFGDTAYAIISHLLHLRERLKPYILAHMRQASQTGLPVMRPLFVDFPADPACWDIADAFMFGPDMLVAPVLAAGQTSRQVYLPPGTNWVDAWDGTPYSGGQTLTVAAPLERIPVFWRAGSTWAFTLSALP